MPQITSQAWTKIKTNPQENFKIRERQPQTGLLAAVRMPVVRFAITGAGDSLQAVMPEIMRAAAMQVAADMPAVVPELDARQVRFPLNNRVHQKWVRVNAININRQSRSPA